MRYREIISLDPLAKEKLLGVMYGGTEAFVRSELDLEARRLDNLLRRAEVRKQVASAEKEAAEAAQIRNGSK